ncbi:MAG: glycine--tRNA ligase [Nanoarchaeota archaeon]|nr:glycine--tRNA ligase [Nanoarchaeota archaeon]
MTLTIEDIAVFCKKKGFVYPSSEIYGGISGFWDFGPLGVELFNNIREHWWKFFVRSRANMVGVDASIISHPRVWKASGHIENFGDLVLTTKQSKTKLRADHFIEDELSISADGMNAEEIMKLIKKHKLQHKGEDFEELKDFNLMLSTKVGADEKNANTAYLRGETAQGMFTNFKLIAETARQQLPFGIAQVGKCFRNEIAPRDFLFRNREFTIAEFEFFIHPDETTCNLLTKKHRSLKLPLLDSKAQAAGKKEPQPTTIEEMLKQNKLGEWHAYWLAEQYRWLLEVGLNPKKLKVREHVATELSHYSSATFDLDYTFPFGSKEIAGNANRGQYDLTQHIKESNEKLTLFDEATKQHIVPRVIEPTFGMERVFLALLVDAYEEDKKRGNIVLKILPQLAPFTVGIFPLVNKLEKDASKIFGLLRDQFSCTFDRSGSIGRRYARADEIGIPYCVTLDFDGVTKKTVTIRDRNSAKQILVKQDELVATIHQLLSGVALSSVGKPIK